MSTSMLVLELTFWVQILNALSFRSHLWLQVVLDYVAQAGLEPQGCILLHLTSSVYKLETVVLLLFF